VGGLLIRGARAIDPFIGNDIIGIDIMTILRKGRQIS
jgi:hypothetical protein